MKRGGKIKMENENLIVDIPESDFGIKMDMSEDELRHWGIKGMKWGVRRYQNADGSLTEAGRKRYNQEVESLKAEKAKLEEREKNRRAQQRMQARTDKLRSEIDELKGKKKSTKEGTTEENSEVKSEGRKPRVLKRHEKPKKPSEMTTEELNAEIDRMRAIKTYNGLYSELNPPEVKRGKEAVKKIFDEGIVPAVSGAVKEVGKDMLTKFGKEALGLNEKKTKTELEKFKEAYEIADYKNKAAKANKEANDLKDVELQKALREQTIAKSEQEKNKAKNGRSDEEVFKDIIDKNPNLSDEQKRDLKEKIDNDEFWAILNAQQ